MKVTKQQKILGGVLMLGAVALMMDRFVFPQAADNAAGGGGDTSSEYSVATSAPAATKPKAIAMAQRSDPQVGLAQRLRNASHGSTDSATPRDAFAVPASWITQPTVVAGERPADQFRRTHRLTGVLASGARAYVTLDGKIVGLGQNVDGFKLTSISHRGAVFEDGNGERVTLNLSERAVAGSEP
jgi:hypothetical protein